MCFLNRLIPTLFNNQPIKKKKILKKETTFNSVHMQQIEVNKINWQILKYYIHTSIQMKLNKIKGI